MKSNNAFIYGVPASTNKKVTMSILAAAVVKVTPDPHAVFPVTCPPLLTQIALMANVLDPVPSCVNTQVKLDVPLAGTFVKSISVTL